MDEEYVTLGVYIFGESKEVSFFIDPSKKYTYDEVKKLAQDALINMADFDNPYHSELAKYMNK